MFSDDVAYKHSNMLFWRLRDSSLSAFRQLAFTQATLLLFAVKWHLIVYVYILLGSGQY